MSNSLKKRVENLEGHNDKLIGLLDMLNKINSIYNEDITRLERRTTNIICLGLVIVIVLAVWAVWV